MFTSELHKATGDDEKLALHLFQHLHCEFLHLQEFQRIAAINSDATCQKLLAPLESRLSANVSTPANKELPAMSEAEATTVRLMAAAVKNAHATAKTATWSASAKTRKSQKEQALSRLLGMGDDSLHGRHAFNVWAEFIGLSQIHHPLKGFHEFLDMWRQVPGPFRNLLGRIGFESFYAACKHADLRFKHEAWQQQQQQWQQQQPGIGRSYHRLGFDGANDILRYVDG